MSLKKRLIGSLLVFFYFFIFISFSFNYKIKLLLTLPLCIGILYELLQFLKCKNIKKYFYFFNILFFFLLNLSSVNLEFIFIFLLTINFCILVYKNILDKDTFLISILVSLYLYFLSAFLKLNTKELIYLLSIVWTTDTFAYFIGTKFGKKRVTLISPKKTIEGTLGGVFIGSFISSFVFFILFKSEIFFHLNIVFFLKIFIISLILSFIAQIGDLFSSYIKRIYNIKDFSNLVYGHGGILDRLDSLLFVSVFIYISFQILFGS